MIQRQTLPNRYSRITYTLLCAAMISMPFTRFLMLPIFIVMGITWLALHPWKATAAYYTANRLWKPLICFGAFFIVTLIGTLYSAHIGAAISDWECKLWFIGAPVFLMPLLPYLTRKQWGLLLFLFALSTCLVSIGNMIWSMIQWLQTGEQAQLFYQNASHFFGDKATHPSYLSLYACFSWMILAETIRKHSFTNTEIRVATFIALVILSIEILFLQSKAGLLAFGFVLLCYAILIAREFKFTRIATAGIAVLVLGIFALVCTLPGAANRISESVTLLQNGDENNPSNGSTQRVVIWETASQLAIQELPFGVGTGDATEILQAAYLENGYTYMYQRQLNCHNQYLQTAITLGIAGLATLILWLLLPLIEGIRKKDALLILFICIVAFNMLVEAMWETRAGSNFIPLTTILLWLRLQTMPSEEDLELHNPANHPSVFVW